MIIMTVKLTSHRSDRTQEGGSMTDCRFREMCLPNSVLSPLNPPVTDGSSRLVMPSLAMLDREIHPMI